MVPYYHCWMLNLQWPNSPEFWSKHRCRKILTIIKQAFGVGLKLYIMPCPFWCLGYIAVKRLELSYFNRRIFQIGWKDWYVSLQNVVSFVVYRYLTCLYLIRKLGFGGSRTRRETRSVFRYLSSLPRCFIKRRNNGEQFHCSHVVSITFISWKGWKNAPSQKWGKYFDDIQLVLTNITNVYYVIWSIL